MECAMLNLDLKSMLITWQTTFITFNRLSYRSRLTDSPNERACSEELLTTTGSL